MEAACYTLDLYCDHEKHRELHPQKFSSLDDQYTGQTYGECKKQAKANGWKWVNNNNWCADCVKFEKETKNGKPTG